MYSQVALGTESEFFFSSSLLAPFHHGGGGESLNHGSHGRGLGLKPHLPSVVPVGAVPADKTALVKLVQTSRTTSRVLIVSPFPIANSLAVACRE